jgi:hypothetical protein
MFSTPHLASEWPICNPTPVFLLLPTARTRLSSPCTTAGPPTPQPQARLGTAVHRTRRRRGRSIRRRLHGSSSDRRPPDRARAKAVQRKRRRESVPRELFLEVRVFRCGSLHDVGARHRLVCEFGWGTRWVGTPRTDQSSKDTATCAAPAGLHASRGRWQRLRERQGSHQRRRETSPSVTVGLGLGEQQGQDMLVSDDPAALLTWAPPAGHPARRSSPCEPALPRLPRKSGRSLKTPMPIKRRTTDRVSRSGGVRC